MRKRKSSYANRATLYVDLIDHSADRQRGLTEKELIPLAATKELSKKSRRHT